MTAYDVAWGSLLAAGLAFEGWALAREKVRGDTLSEFTRKVFRTGYPDRPEVKRSKTGRVIFGVAWAGFAGWYLYHILWQVW